MRSLSFCAQFLTGVGLGLGLMVSDLCGYTSLIGFVCRFSSSLPAVEGNVGFVRSLHMSVLKMKLSGYPSYLCARHLLNGGEGEGCFGSIKRLLFRTEGCGLVTRWDCCTMPSSWRAYNIRCPGRTRRCPSLYPPSSCTRTTLERREGPSSNLTERRSPTWCPLSILDW